MDADLYEYLDNRLLTSIRRNDINAVSMLMGLLTEIEVQGIVTDENIQGQSLIFHACQAKATRIVEYLVVKCGADINMVAKIGGERLTPLLLAIKIKCTYLLMKLISLQADMTSKGRKNLNPLVYACLNDNHEAAEILRDNNININSDMNVYYSGLNERYFKMALKFGTDIQYPDSAGNTILMRAALNGKLEIILWLVKASNEVYHRNNTGANALDLANLKKRKIVIPFLLNNFYSRNDYTLSLEYCGAYVLLKFKDIKRCIAFWKKSLVQRRTYSNQISPKSNFVPTDFPLNTREFDIDTDLGYREEKDLLINALLVFYRILSPQSSVTKKAFYSVVLSRCPGVDMTTRFILLNHVMELNASSIRQDEGEIIYSWQVLVNLISKYLRKIENNGTTIEEISQLTIEFMETLRYYVKPFLIGNPGRVFLYREKYKSLQTMGLKYLQYLVDETPDYRSLAVFLAKSLCEDDSETSTTVLHMAISNKMSPRVVEVLIEGGSDVNAVDDKGNTPLHLLIERPLTDTSREKIARVLVRAGCDLNAKNNSNVVLRDYFGSFRLKMPCPFLPLNFCSVLHSSS